ncbi:MAG: bifunctional [glutamate--ammonia ligase]-adenylyl-L-tyrosine phosphorylase/[glutamate--ammonia-ligase] adenylyltransferase [Desulfobacterales bacterium]|nr:bifunctional [glutamate--ammonia ligase]-adenylyl-L-tyrosine phosphorylase/[glutamate--ammonia-ligase] adenylyltransferase [Desulfobacterales bacterium]
MIQKLPLPEQLVEDGLNKWSRFCEAAARNEITITDEVFFAEEAQRVFAFSDYVPKRCTQNPGMLIDLIETGDLYRQYSSETYREKLSAITSAVQEVSDLGECLKRFRAREMVRIAWRDLSGRADLDDVMTCMTWFADACIDISLSILFRQFCERYGKPLNNNGVLQQLVVIGMGKLGGVELNFSSDIDLIFAYPETGETDGGENSINNEEFFIRLGRALIKTLGTSTGDGLVFRVDMRLRPYGENGPLVMSFDNMEQYYQSQGREWERYAWIKARVVAGDAVSGKKLMMRLKPFIYRRYLDYGVFESLRRMKLKIETEVKLQNLKDNIKLGTGGIREIEFFGQIFQLIRGGVTSSLQAQQILKVLFLLVGEECITETVFKELSCAYVFLRNVEHRLQEFSDRQIHDLPAGQPDRQRVAISMGFKSWDDFKAGLTGHTDIVHKHFTRLLDIRQTDEKDKHFDDLLSGIWLGDAGPERGSELLSAAGFEKPDDLLRLLADLKEDPATRALSSNGRAKLDRLVPHILNQASKSDDPILTLNRIIELIKVIERRTTYIDLLLENPQALIILVKLADISPWIISFLAKHPVLLDELLDPRTLYRLPTKSELEEELDHRIASIPADDLEYQMEALRIFKQVNILRVAAADVTAAMPLMRVSDHLSNIAITVVDKALDIAWNHLTGIHGIPSCRHEGEIRGRGFAVIAYGKLGGIELGYGSDLDLVFLHAGINAPTKGGSRPIDSHQFFMRLGQRLVHILTAHTSAGRLYETDMRLRPSGSSGLLVSHVERFRNYQLKMARTWENQAIIRARPICGDDSLARYFDKIRSQVLSDKREEVALKNEVTDMRERLRSENIMIRPGMFDLKQGKGGIVDIEFLVQYLILLNAFKHPSLVIWTDNIRLLETLAAEAVISNKMVGQLKDAYIIYRSDVHNLDLQEKPELVHEYKFRALRKFVISVWDEIFNS